MTTPKTSYRIISLDKGQVTLVSLCDYGWLSKWNWFAQWCEDTQSFYAARTDWDGRRRTRILMHRLILGLVYKDGKVGDHRDGNTLDNRRNNLRVATYAGNTQNTQGRKDNTSGCRRVYFHRPNGKWYARVYVKKHMISLGHFVDKVDAIAARCAAVKEHYGEFVRER